MAGRWDLSFPNRDRTHIPFTEDGFLTTEQPGKTL